MSSITLEKLLNALQTQEQRRLMRQEGSMEDAFQAISQYKKEMQSNNNSNNNTQKFPPCPYCKNIQSFTKKVLVEAGCKMSQVCLARTCGKDMQISTVARRSQGEVLLC